MRKSNVMFALLDVVMRLFIGAIFVISGFVKLEDISAFSKVIREYKILPEIFIPFFSIALPVVELVAGLFVILGFLIKPAILIIMILLMIFITVIIPNIGEGGIISDCGCFGGLMDSEVGVGLLMRDFCFLIIAIITFSLKKHPWSLEEKLDLKILSHFKIFQGNAILKKVVMEKNRVVFLLRVIVGSVLF